MDRRHRRAVLEHEAEHARHETSHHQRQHDQPPRPADPRRGREEDAQHERCSRADRPQEAGAPDDHLELRAPILVERGSGLPGGRGRERFHGRVVSSPSSRPSAERALRARDRSGRAAAWLARRRAATRDHASAKPRWRGARAARRCGLRVSIRLFEGATRSGDGETQTRTGDTTIFSRVLYQLSYLAGTPSDASGSP